MQQAPQLTLKQKVDFLLQPDSHPDHPRSVESIETHFAWVFLSDRFVYKLKKPVRFQHVDFTSLETRKENCELEVALNRRLAQPVYIAVVPLSAVNSRMRLEGDGPPIEWLVKMHRLPSERMLDQAALDGSITVSDLRRLVTKLATFYRGSDRAPWSGTEYVERLEREVRNYGNRLSTPSMEVPSESIERLVTAQRRFIHDRAKLLRERVIQGRVVDAHGDLRPEHICLTEPPQIIDCLEFSREHRLLDSAEEISFLALECERIGHRVLGEQILELYRELLEDPIAPEFFHFYRSKCALIRAYLSAWHLIDDDARGAERWVQRTNWYLDAAQASIDAALADRI